MKRRGFTFIELLVVIGIICTLVSVIYPAMRRVQELNKGVPARQVPVQMPQAQEYRSPTFQAPTFVSQSLEADTSKGCGCKCSK